MFAYDLRYPSGNALGHCTFCYRIWLGECHKKIDPSTQDFVNFKKKIDGFKSW